MTNLAIDIGNTQVKYGVFQGNMLVAAETTADPDVVMAESLIRSHGVTHILAASVRTPEAMASLQPLAQQVKTFVELGPDTEIPIHNLYQSPGTLGTDRLAAATAAFVLYRQHMRNLLVVMAGTCITYNLVTAGGSFLGGAISPGLHMRFEALNHYTDRLPLVEPSEEQQVVGRNTEASIVSGVQLGMISEVEGMVEKYTAQYPDLITVISGGDAPFLQKHIKTQIFAHPHLVLEGLNQILIHHVQ